MLNSLEVFLDGNNIVSVHRVLGVPISRKRMHRNAFVRFSRKSTFQARSGSEHVILYSTGTVDGEGTEVIVGEGFKGNDGADAAIRLSASELGLHEKAGGDRLVTKRTLRRATC